MPAADHTGLHHPCSVIVIVFVPVMLLAIVNGNSSVKQLHTTVAQMPLRHTTHIPTPSCLTLWLISADLSADLSVICFIYATLCFVSHSISSTMAGPRKRAGSSPKKTPKKAKTRPKAQPKVQKTYSSGAVEMSFQIDSMCLSD